MKAMLLNVVLAMTIGLVGCEKSVTTQPSPPVAAAVAPEPPAAWQRQLDQFSATVKVGMTEDAVVAAVGEPPRVKNLGPPFPVVTWEYDLGDERHFVVRFDRSNRVAVAELKTQIKPM